VENLLYADVSRPQRHDSPRAPIHSTSTTNMPSISSKRANPQLSRVRIVVVVEIDGTPRELRKRYIEANWQAIQRAWSAGRVDISVAEELIRALPAEGRR
jgi:hypothetical protein